MTTGGGGSGKPPDVRDDPMQQPASDAGWEDERPTSRSVPIVSPPAGAAAPAAPSSSPRGLSFPAYSPARAADAAAPAPSPAGDARPTGSSSTAPPRAAATSSTAPAAHRDDPALPDTPDKYDEDELRAAVGAAPLSTSGKQRATSNHAEGDAEDDAAEVPQRRNPRTVLFAALGITAGLGIAALVVVGYLNSDRYILTCEAERAVPERGRGLPPWGTRALSGEPWRPLKIAPETRCQPQETDDPLVLERAFLAMVLDQATALLTARAVDRVDDAEALLQQGLLLTRPPEHEPEPLARQRTEHHQEIERLLGDVAYWRATARLREAAAALGDAAAKFDAAVAQHPRHVSDAGAWAAYARKLAQELHAGPAGAPFAASSAVPPGTPSAPSPPGPAGASERLAAPAGVALPVEPDGASATPPAQAVPPPDAGAPTGGVLL